MLLIARVKAVDLASTVKSGAATDKMIAAPFTHKVLDFQKLFLLRSWVIVFIPGVRDL